MKKRLIIIFMAAMLATTCVVPAVHADEISDNLNISAVNEEASYDEYDSADDVIITDDYDEGVSEEILEDSSEEASSNYDQGAYEDEENEEEEVSEGESLDGEIHAADADFHAYAADTTSSEQTLTLSTGEQASVEVDVYGIVDTIDWIIDDEDDYDYMDNTSFTFTVLDHNFDILCELMDVDGYHAEVVFHIIVEGGTESNVEPVEGVFEVSNNMTDSEMSLYYSNSTELYVDITNTYGTDVSYEWTKNGTVIEGETEFYCEVTEGGLYTCRAYDDMGHEGTVEFPVHGYKDLGAKVANPDDDDKTEYITVSNDEDMTLEVDDSEIEEEVTYSWSFIDNNFNTDDNIGNSRVLIVSTDDLKSGEYVCTVSDGYNEDLLYYYVTVDNNLEASVFPFEEQNSSSTTITVNEGEDVDLTVYVRASDTNGITYEWYDYGPSGKLDNHSNTITITNVTEPHYFQCKVTDKYGNSVFVYHTIALDNNLTVSASATELVSEKTVEVSSSSVILKVYADAKDTSGINYRWFDDYDEYDGKSSEFVVGSDILKTIAPGEVKWFGCHVTDSYGNSAYVYFNIEMNGFLSLEKSVMNLGLMQTDTNHVTMAATDDIVRIVPANESVATATYNGSDLVVTAGSVGGSTNIAVKTATGKVVKFKVIVPKPTLSFTHNKEAVSTTVPVMMGKSEMAVVTANMAAGDSITKVVPANTNIVTATYNGSKITLKAGTVYGSTNIAVKTATGKVMKFKVTVPKPTLSFTWNGNNASLENPVKVKVSKSTKVEAAMVSGDSIEKIVPSNSRVTCTWSENTITVKAGKTTGYSNIAVKTKWGKVVKFRVSIVK